MMAKPMKTRIALSNDPVFKYPPVFKTALKDLKDN